MISPKKKNLFKSKDNLLFLTILAFVLISSTALSLSKDFRTVINKIPVLAREEKTYYPIPILTGSNFPTISAQGALAVDLDSGVGLYEKNPDANLLPASTTKIVTALVALDHFKSDQVLTVPQLKAKGQRMGLSVGEQMKFQDLLYGLLVYSANDAAETIAENYCSVTCGSDVFVGAMNDKAKQLSMTNSSFQNPVGFDGSRQFTTARDLIRVSEVAMRSPEFAKIVGTKEILLTDVLGKSKYNLKNINELLGSVPGVLGVKTGWTENARENLVTYIERDSHKIMIAILGSQDRFGETKELIDWIFENYSWQEVRPK